MEKTDRIKAFLLFSHVSSQHELEAVFSPDDVPVIIESRERIMKKQLGRHSMHTLGLVNGVSSVADIIELSVNHPHITVLELCNLIDDDVLALL